MKTSSVLAAAAALFAAVAAAFTQPPPDDRPSLPPIVLEPGVKLPPPAPADVVKPSPLPPLPPVVPAPLPVPQPIFPAAKAEPTKLPIVPPPPVAPLPLPAPLPQVPPALPLPPLVTKDPRTAGGLPQVPPPALPLPPPQTVTPTLPPSAGSVVVLQDGKVVEGHVSRMEDKVIVRRGGADQKFPTEQVKYVAASKDEAYRLALKDTKADDAASRLRLARWCMVTGMRENALTEAKEAARLEPANRTAVGLVRTLEESLRLFPGDGTVRVTPPAPPPGLPAVPPPPPSPPVTPVVTVPELDVAAEAVMAFGPRVQPVLMNQCASCHAKADHASGYRLTTVASNEVNAAATRANLAATAAQVKKADPAASPLLVKATTAHGGQAVPAFADRAAAPYRVLQAWVYLSRGELAPPVAAAPPVLLPPPPVLLLPPPPVLPMVPPPVLPLPVAPPPPIPPAEGSIPPIPPASDNPGFGRTAPPPIPLVPAKDDFDPDNFNRR